MQQKSNDSVPLYVRSIDCPNEYIDYASENISKFINPLEITNPDDVMLGTPFSFAEADADVFYFPVMDSGKMKFLLRVYPDGKGYSAVLSAFLVNEIESLATLTSPEAPLNLLMVDNKIVAMIGENSYPLFDYPSFFDCTSNTYSFGEEPNYSTINAKHVTQSVDMKQTRDVYTLIDLNVTEHQSAGYNWCNAYCLATVIKTLLPKKLANANFLMGIVYNDQQKPSDHLPWACVYELSQMYGLSPDVVENPVERITLINELNSGRPSIFWMKHDDSESGGHAIVLRGFFVNATTWSIWNPWYTTGNEIPVYEQFPIDGTYLPMTKHTSNWNLHVYGVAHGF